MCFNCMVQGIHNTMLVGTSEAIEAGHENACFEIPFDEDEDPDEVYDAAELAASLVSRDARIYEIDIETDDEAVQCVISLVGNAEELHQKGVAAGLIEPGEHLERAPPKATRRFLTVSDVKYWLN